MGEVSCDILTGENVCCVFVRFANTTHQKITSFRTPAGFDESQYELVSHAVFYKATLPTFPSELGTFFPNLKYVDIFDCAVETVTRDDLKSFPKLEKLKLESNKLRFLPGDLLAFTPNITHLNFSYNRIDKIGPNLLDNCKDLFRADFRSNRTISYNYRKDSRRIEELKAIIERDCKPLRALWELAADAVTLDDDAEYVAHIATQLGIAKLKLRAENVFLDIRI